MSRLRSLGFTVVTEPDNPQLFGTDSKSRALQTLNLGALSNPEGSILLVDAKGPAYVAPFDDVRGFIAHVKRISEPAQKVRAISISGVGSSALGSVALAWNISAALDEPVAAIVPGYGLADVVQQALGGWFGFGLYNFWVKERTQDVLALAAPASAGIGRALMETAPGSKRAVTGAPIFRRGNGSSDVLHAILAEVEDVTHLFGHSKGALDIKNAVNDLPTETTDRLHLVTLGCPVDETAPPAVHYFQVLGRFDWVGWLNSWGNSPDVQIWANHSTNTEIPFSMCVEKLARRARGPLGEIKIPDEFQREIRPGNGLVPVMGGTGFPRTAARPGR
jgi:hypothetical protein